MKSIRTKLSLLITVLIALSLISISFFGYQSAKKSLNSLNDSYIQTEVKANQDSLSSYFETKSKMVEGIANLEGLQKANPTTGVKAIAAIYPEFQQEFANVSFANASGTRWNYKGEQDTVANRNYFQQAMSTKKTTISDVLVSSTTGKMSMVIASPIMEYGKSPVGIAYTTLPLDEITTNIQQIKYGESGFGYIFTENGVTVAHGKKQDIVGKAFLQDAVQKDPELTLADSPEMTAYWNHRNDGSPFILDNGDGKYINYIVQLSVPTVNPLYFGFSVKEAELNQQIHALARTFLVISCIVLIISIVVSMVFITILITNSIKKLRNVAQQITEGNLDIDINIHSNDEIGEVAKALGGTVVRLKSYQAYINEIALALKDISQGNLTFDLTHDYSGEFSKIKDALTDIRSTLSSALNQIGEVSELVEGKAAQLSSGASQLAQGTEEQASAIEELSASINEISEKVQTSASHTQETTQTTAESFHLIENSNKEMKNMMSAMEDIRSTSSEIGKIIKTIDDIAFQTNILSLNAAVEAARAGEAGKGFAVVADQVRNLAGMSAEAAKNSASLIETAVKAVNHGADLAETSASMLDQVMESSRKSYQLIEEISRDSSHQAESLAQVTTGVEQISSVVQTSSATAQESAATSAELSEQAEVLRKLVQQFHI